MKRVLALGCCVLLIVAACAGSGSGAGTIAPTASTLSPHTVPSTLAPVVDPTTTATATTTTTTTTTALPTCDVARATEILDAALALARLTPGGPWISSDASTSVFDARTDDAATFADRMSYDCGVRLVQGGDIDRLALVVWNAHRHAFVIQAADAPSTTYGTAIRFQLFIEQPYGEWLHDQYVWAATMAGGESIVVGTSDDSAALTAKSWQSTVPAFDDLPITIESERFGIGALVAAGARKVAVAEPASYDSTIGTIHFRTPYALTAYAVIGPADSFDPAVPLSAGHTTVSRIDGVDVSITAGVEIGFDLFETGWVCGTHVWRLYTGGGSIEELTEFTQILIASLTC